MEIRYAWSCVAGMCRMMMLSDADVVGGPALPRVHAEQQHVDRAVQARRRPRRRTCRRRRAGCAGRCPRSPGRSATLLPTMAHAAAEHQHRPEDHGQPGPERVLALRSASSPTRRPGPATGRRRAGDRPARRPRGAAAPVWPRRPGRWGRRTRGTKGDDWPEPACVLQLVIRRGRHHCTYIKSTWRVHPGSIRTSISRGQSIVAAR